MSRFDSGRRLRIAVWTGAALAWGTTAAVAAQRSIDATSPDALQPPAAVPPAVNEVSSPSTLPTMPRGGLVVLRYQPTPGEQPEVRTVYVRQAAPAAAPARPATPAPTPRSSGS